MQNLPGGVGMNCWKKNLATFVTFGIFLRHKGREQSLHRHKQGDARRIQKAECKELGKKVLFLGASGKDYRAIVEQLRIGTFRM